MKAILQILTLGLASAVMALPEPTITPPPQLAAMELRADRPAFIGYMSKNETYSASSCGVGYWTEIDNVGGCVTQNGSPIPTACVNSSVMKFANGASGTCTSSMTCSYYSIFDNLDQQTTVSYYLCFPSQAAKRSPMYRATTTGKASTTSSTKSSSTVPSTTADATSSTTEIPTDSADSGSSSGGGQNLAWIAGPIIGGLAGLAIIGLLIWVVLLLKKRRNANQGPEAPGETTQYQPSPGQQHPQYQPAYGEQQPYPQSAYGSPQGDHLKHYSYVPPPTGSAEHAQPYLPPQQYPPQWTYAQSAATTDVHSTIPSELPAANAPVEIGDSVRK
ncbi:unnamed protein product [Clonostachys rosea]|uniref:Mid2 domain-containing protein n=1 Tax=Bionectria ochroleuca TaxID=29856 RepID=A0ABY6TV47_BIOOC|nr:unnamed protein product [Clonostachys rosea]